MILKKPYHTKIWVDLDNSPHIPFFIPIIRRLEEGGYRAVLTGRNCFQVCQLIDLHNLDCKIIGRHYGKTTLLKILGTFIRAAQLACYVVRSRPGFAISHGSRAQILVCRLLGIPCLAMCDYEHSKLGIQPDWLLVPAAVANCESRVPQNRVMSYPGIKEDVYVPGFRADACNRANLGLSENKIVVIVRPPATEAHYRSSDSDLLYEAVMEHLIAKPGIQIILLPRSDTQAKCAQTKWANAFNAGTITIPATAVDGLSLIWHSDLVISGGGTMNREAAALGIPVYSIFRGATGAVDRSLELAGRLIFLKCIDEIQDKLVLQRRPESSRVQRRDNRTLDIVVENIVSAIHSTECVRTRRNRTNVSLTHSR